MRETYSLTPVQADAILRMTLGQLVNLEQEKLGGEHQELLTKIREYNRILSDRANILEIIREDLKELKKRYPEPRRTEISGEEIGEVDLEDLIPEETMVVSISSNGYIKRTPVSAYRAQHRGGKGLTGAKTEEEDPIEHLFVASTHSYLMFFTNQGKVYWRKVYDLPQSARDSRGRAVVNLLSLQEGERITDCRAVRDFDLPDHYLVMATVKGLVKKTPLKAYCHPRTGGIIAIKLREGDQLVDVVVARQGDELVLATAKGMAIRFKESDARPMGRGASGVKGIRLSGDDQVVGMVVADPEATLLTACANGYGKRTPFGPNVEAALVEGPAAIDLPEGEADDYEAPDPLDAAEPDEPEEAAGAESPEGEGEDEPSSSRSYRTQHRGGKGIRDIKTTAAQRPGDRHRPHPRGRRIADDDGPRQDPADPFRRHPHHRPQYPGRAFHEPRRRRYPGGRETRAPRGNRRNDRTGGRRKNRTGNGKGVDRETCRRGNRLRGTGHGHLPCRDGQRRDLRRLRRAEDRTPAARRSSDL